jgi:hypothetical protein
MRPTSKEIMLSEMPFRKKTADKCFYRPLFCSPAGFT